MKKSISCCLKYLFDLFCLVNAAWSDADFSPDSGQDTFSLEEELLWIMDSYLS